MNETARYFEWQGEHIFAILHEPLVPTHKIVIMHHGFTGSSTEAQFAFVRYARELVQRGFAVLRFDFVGSGNSSGSFAEMTFTKELAQAQLILETVMTWPWVEDISLHGFSMGGAVASQLAARFPDTVKKLLLWAPAGDLASLTNRMYEFAQPLANGNYDWHGLELGAAFLAELPQLHLPTGCEAYHGPVKIIQGMNDTAVPASTPEVFANQYGRDIEIHYIDEADHTFASLDWLSELFNESTKFMCSE